MNTDQLSSFGSLQDNFPFLDLPRAPFVKRKAKETEDIKTQKNFLIRQVSDRTLKKGELSEAQELANRTGEIWDCVGRIPSKFGYIYQFSIKEAYNIDPLISKSDDLENRLDFLNTPEGRSEKDILLKQIRELNKRILDKNRAMEKKSEDIYPAAEPTNYNELSALSPLMNYRPYYPLDTDQIEDIIQTLNQLGYRFENNNDKAILSLPDRETLLYNWKERQEKNPSLPCLDIVSSEGIATDLDFAEAYFLYNALLSSGKEFVHDHTAHVVRSVLRALFINKSPIHISYEDLHNQFAKTIIKDYQRIMIAKIAIEQSKLGNVTDDLFSSENLPFLERALEKFEFFLGFMVDVLTTAESPSELMQDLQESENSILEAAFNSIWDEVKGVALKRFPEEKLDKVFLLRVWNQIKEYATSARLRD